MVTLLRGRCGAKSGVVLILTQPQRERKRNWARMAIRKSELYASLWASCDELRGGMDASQYKDYVLAMLFIKYVSDKYAGVPYSPIVVPEGASFADMVALKGKPDIGDQINKQIFGRLTEANQQLARSDFPNVNDPVKLGDGKEMVDRLTNLVAIFENPALDFSRNRAAGDDLLGDAYEYLMRHFATESGKSKGQFYTPTEVSRIMAQVIGIRDDRTTNATTVYDPTCGSGSLLLKVGDEAKAEVTLYGQEKDAATSGLARMNLILHDCPTALVNQGNTLANPLFKDGDRLKTFDYVVANPPFSDKRWSNGIDPMNDPYDRFAPFGVPPAKQGDYAYLLHIVRSLKSTGVGACILPHGVLFRGNAEADIRRSLVRKGYIRGIIGLPANLFYGTGIPACIVVIDKREAHARKGIFMIDASAGFKKDGPKNRLRDRDIHRIVDVFARRVDVPKYARMVPAEEIERNDFNLNLPRYIDSSEPEDIQDIAGHLQGGIPVADVDALARYGEVCPELRRALFKRKRAGYVALRGDAAGTRHTIFEHPEFAGFAEDMRNVWDIWRRGAAKRLKGLQMGFLPKQLIAEESERLLAHYNGKPLVSHYAVYQHQMDYWAEVMQDDAYLIATDGWKAETSRILERDKKGREKDKGWTCDLVPKPRIVARYFASEQAAIDALAAELERVTAELAELEEEHGAEAELDDKAYARYPELTAADIKTLVVDDKWLASLGSAVRGEVDRVSRQLAQRVRDLAERYEDGDLDITDHTVQVAWLYQRKQATYSENKVYPRIQVEDLRSDMIEWCRNHMRINRKNHPWGDMDDLQLLKSAQLYQADPESGALGVTLAGVMLFGTDNQILQVCPAHRTDLILRKVNVDRYDDRDLVRTNLIHSYDRILDFIRKHLADPFYLEGTDRKSLREAVFREVASNMLIHREYASGVPARLIIEYGKVTTYNANRPHGFGILDPETSAPYPKNPVIGAFFREIDRADELGSGMRNMMQYGKEYGGEDPQLIEGDVFRMIISVPEFGGEPGTAQVATQVTGQVTGQVATHDKSLLYSNLARVEQACADATGQVTGQVTAQVAAQVMRFCEQDRSAKQIQELLGLKHRETFLNNYLKPLLASGWIEMTIPGKPRSSKQKYRLTDKGRAVLKELES